MQTILCLLLAVAVCSIAHAGQFDSISEMIDDMANTDGITKTKENKDKRTGNNLFGNMASAFENEAMVPLKIVNKLTEGFMGVPMKEKNKNSKDGEAKNEN